MSNKNNKPFPLRQMILCALFAALIAVGAFIRIPIPLIPLTLQTAFVSLAGLLLGAKWGAYSALLYLLIGLLGVPVFTGGGGFGYVLQPTFGYLLGFVGGAWLTGLLSRTPAEGRPGYWPLLRACLAGLAVVYICGLSYCWLISNTVLGSGLKLWPLFVSGFLLVIPGDLLLSLLVAKLAQRLLPQLRR